MSFVLLGLPHNFYPIGIHIQKNLNLEQIPEIIQLSVFCLELKVACGEEGIISKFLVILSQKSCLFSGLKSKEILLNPHICPDFLQIGTEQ